MERINIASNVGCMALIVPATSTTPLGQSTLAINWGWCSAECSIACASNSMTQPALSPSPWKSIALVRMTKTAEHDEIISTRGHLFPTIVGRSEDRSTCVFHSGLDDWSIYRKPHRRQYVLVSLLNEPYLLIHSAMWKGQKGRCIFDVKWSNTIQVWQSASN